VDIDGIEDGSGLSRSSLFLPRRRQNGQCTAVDAVPGKAMAFVMQPQVEPQRDLRSRYQSSLSDENLEGL
jgi:hypothetical protein